MKTLLISVEDRAEAESLVAENGGEIHFYLGDQLAVIELPDELDDQALNQFSVVTGTDAEQRRDEEALLVAGWHGVARVDEEVRARPAQAIPWDADGIENAPLLVRRPERSAPEQAPRKVYNSDLNGKVAVGLVLVSGPGDLSVSFDEQQYTISQVLYGLLRLKQKNPLGKLVIHLDLPKVISIDAHAQKCDSYAQCESVWEPKVLQELGVNSLEAAVANVANENHVDRAYIAFFTKYPTYHYAYTSTTDSFGVVYMEYKNGHRGPENIWNVFMHESMHVFHAHDEYKKSNCVCSDRSGFFSASNCNCLNCGGDKLDCVMNVNQPVVCTWSRRQVGWDGASPQFNISDVNDAKTTEAPALVFDDGKKVLNLIFRGDDNGVLHMCTRSNAAVAKWSTQQKVLPGGEQTRTKWTPAATMHKGRCYLAYAGASDEGNIYLTSSDSSAWSVASRITDQHKSRCAAGPALTSFQKNLHLVFRSKQNSGELLHSFSSDGTQWTTPTPIPHGDTSAKTSSQPALAFYANKLFLAFRGITGEANLYLCWFDGKAWSAPIRVTDINKARTAHGPALATLDDALLVFWQGNSDASDIWACAVRPKAIGSGVTVSDQFSVAEQNGAQCGHAVAAAPFEGGVQLAYRGHTSHNIWTCHYAANAPHKTQFGYLWQAC